MFETAFDCLESSRMPPWVRNISKVYIGDVLSKIFAVGTLILLIRSLSVSDYAVYTVFYTIAALMPGLVGNGINMAMVRFSAEQLSLTGKKALELYVASLVFQIVLYAGLCSVLLLAGSDTLDTLLFGEKTFGGALKCGLIAGLGLLVTQAGRSIYQAEERFGTYIKTLCLRQILIFLPILVLFLLGRLDFQHAALSIIVVELATAALVSCHIFWSFSLREVVSALRKRFDVVKDFFAASRWLIAYTVTLVAFGRLNIFMLSHLSTKYELANFGVAYRYFGLALLLLGSIHAVLLPVLSKVEMQEVNNQRNFAAKWVKVVCWSIVPMIIAILLLKPAFIWINGKQYDRAFYILVAFIPCIWIGLTCSPLVNIIIARKAFGFLFVLGAAALVLNVVGNYLLIPSLGGLGAAVVVGLSHALVNLNCGFRVLFLRR